MRLNSTATTAAIVGAAVAGGVSAVSLWRGARVESLRRRLPKHKRFLILGAGFGGMTAARELARLLPDGELGDITLVDERGFLLFTPMLTEVAGGELDGRHVVAPPQKLASRVTFERGHIETIDLNSRRVTVTLSAGLSGIPPEDRTLEADHLVIALGSTTNFHDVPGAEQHACMIKNVDEAIAIRNRALDLLQRASVEPNKESRRELLTFVVAGGGYTGVETMAAVNGLVRHGAAGFARIQPDEIRMMLVEPGDRLMTETTAELAAYAKRKLQQRGVEVLLKSKITRAEEGFIELDGNRRVPMRTLIWAGGVKPNPVVESLNCQRGKHGGILVDPACAVPGFRAVWAIGDCAEIPNQSGQTYAPTAQNATREGRHVARNIVRKLLGEAVRPFRYKPAGELALVGKHSGVARLYGVEFSGIAPWVMWRAVYLTKMPAASQRVRIGLDWLLDSIFGRNLADIHVERS